MKDKILFIVNGNVGGAERMTLLYSKILHNAGFDCRILVSAGKDNFFPLKSFMPKAIPFDVYVGRYRYQWRYFIKSIKTYNPDYVFVSSTLSFLSLIPYKMFWESRIKIIYRESIMPAVRKKRLSGTIRLFISKASGVISQTDEMKHEMCKIYKLSPEFITTINNPIDKQRILDSLQETFHFPEKEYIHYIAVGRIAPQKDYITLLKSFAKLLSMCPNSILHILGIDNDANYKTELNILIHELNIGDKVFFEGLQENPYKYINASDVFVLSSLYEGLPNVLLEAMYLGKPVVSTNSVPFVTQVIKEGINGYVVPIGNVDMLTEKMLEARNLIIRERFIDATHTEDKVVEFFKSI